MRHLIGLALLALACTAQTNETESTQDPAQKEGAGEGRSYGDYGHHDRHHHHKERRYNHGLVDDYVCDIDASILIVTQVKSSQPQSYGPSVPPPPPTQYNGQMPPPQYQGQAPPPSTSWRSKRSFPGGNNYQQPPQYQQQPPPTGQYPPPPQQGYSPAPSYPPQNNYGQGNGYGQQPYYPPPPPSPEPNADRLRCSGIAYTSLEDCQVCCKLAARHDQSFSKHDVVGFLIDFNQLDFQGGSPFTSVANQAIQSGYGAPNVPPPDSRCLCCAPKRKVYYRKHYGHHQGGY